MKKGFVILPTLLILMNFMACRNDTANDEIIDIIGIANYSKYSSIGIGNINDTSSRFSRAASNEGYKIIGYFLESKIKDCIERNNQRVGKACIPAKAIAATSNKLQLPSYDEGFDKLYFVKNNGSDMVIEDWR